MRTITDDFNGSEVKLAKEVRGVLGYDIKSSSWILLQRG